VDYWTNEDRRTAGLDAVHNIQAGYKITPLSQLGKAAQPVEGKVDPSVDMQTPPKIQVDTMPADKFGRLWVVDSRQSGPPSRCHPGRWDSVPEIAPVNPAG
jgi:hypothetical protein